MNFKNNYTQRIINAIPSPTLRDAVEGYTESIIGVAPDIFKDAGIKIKPHLLERFIFCVTVRRLWAVVDTQYRLLTSSLHTTEKTGLKGYLVHGRNYSFGSKDYNEITEFRSKFFDLLVELDIALLISLPTLIDLLIELDRGIENES